MKCIINMLRSPALLSEKKHIWMKILKQVETSDKQTRSRAIENEEICKHLLSQTVSNRKNVFIIVVV